MIKLTNRPMIATALVIGSLTMAGTIPSVRAAQNKLPPPKHENAAKVEFFAGKIEELNVEAKWLKVDKQTYHITDKTKLLNRDKEIKLENLKVGTEVHGLAKKDDSGSLQATIVKVGPKPNEGPGPRNGHQKQ